MATNKTVTATPKSPAAFMQEEIQRLKLQAADLMGRARRHAEDVLALERYYEASTAQFRSQPFKVVRRTIADEVEVMLRASGRPMHVSEMIPRLQESGVLKAKNRNTAGNAVFIALRRRGDKFKKVGHGLYAFNGDAK